MPDAAPSDIDIRNPQRVVLDVSRWTARLTITDADGVEREWVLSADSYLTGHDCIYYGTVDEWQEALRA